VIYLLAFVVLVLAVARATRVIVIDEVAAPLRNRVFATFGEDGRMAKLFRCYWCSGFWMSALACTYTSAIGYLPWKAMPVLTFAVAYAAAWVLDKEGLADGI
jgi:hypothetical protein